MAKNSTIKPDTVLEFEFPPEVNLAFTRQVGADDYSRPAPPLMRDGKLVWRGTYAQLETAFFILGYIDYDAEGNVISKVAKPELPY